MVFLILLFFNISYASEQSEAIDHSLKAALTYPEIKQKIEIASDKLLKYSPFEKHTTQNILITAMVLVKGKISTERFKMFTYNFENGYIRPDAIYNFRSVETVVTVDYKLEFP